MLIAIYGMFATGKTYAMVHYRDRLADACHADHRLVVVTADVNTLYILSKDRSKWVQQRGYQPMWKGKQTDKFEQLMHMITDTTTVWVVESARYFGGMQDYVREAAIASGGGIVFVSPTTDSKTGRKFLVDRAAKAGKTFRDDYWDQKRLEYECRGRYINSIERNYIQLGIPMWELPMDYNRTHWSIGMDILSDIVSWPHDKWYSMVKSVRSTHAITPKNNPSKRVKREREDHHSQTVDSQIVRQPLTRRIR